MLPSGSKIIFATEKETSVCVALHGYGDNAENFSTLASEIGHRFTTWVCVNGCFSASFPTGRQWFNLYADYKNDLRHSVGVVSKIISEVFSTQGLSKNKTPHSKISLLGFSQGAALSWALALESEKAMHSVFALSGFLPFRHSLKPTLCALKETKFYVAHGSQDQVVLPMHHYETIDFLTQIEVKQLEHSVFQMPHTLHPQQILRLSLLMGEKNL
jgi:phospholipase/carboxylesterase